MEVIVDFFMFYLQVEFFLGLEVLELLCQEKWVGFVIVDEENGFCMVGVGNLVSFLSILFIKLQFLYIKQVLFYCRYIGFVGIKRIVESDYLYG